MDDPWAVEVLDTPQDLVEEHLYVVCGEVLGRHDDLVQIALHQLRDEVDFLKKVDVRGLKIKIEFKVISFHECIKNWSDIFQLMAEKGQKEKKKIVICLLRIDNKNYLKSILLLYCFDIVAVFLFY